MENKIYEMVKRASSGARLLSAATTTEKNNLLASLASELQKREKDLLKANQQDIEKAKNNGMLPHMLDRLALNSARIADLIKSIGNVINLNDPIGEIEDYRTLENGMQVGRMRIPLGLLAFICEARPGAPLEAVSLALKSGNGLIVKAGKEMSQTALIINEIIKTATKGIYGGAIEVLSELTHEEVKYLLTLNNLIDLVIPRGGEGLIKFIDENSRIPVLKHYKGVCHTYIDEGADLKMALELVLNAKVNRPSTCNSLECLLVNRKVASDFLPILMDKLKENKVSVLTSAQDLPLMPGAKTSSYEIWGVEFLNLTLAVKIVDDINEAMEHIANYGSKHTDTIVTNDYLRSQIFLKQVDSSCVMVNASTRLNDGGSLGLGAEIGISTSKMHAYGPMGLKELSTTKFIVLGQGNIRA